ncbi:LUD domain-containing protein [Natrarchaeobaculum aegyptiacum]|uniref:Lactate utilization protein C n=1 Tax=Natrarchaeobaculum aegyptiacum TaxID=745377 RepID=A0A2Z2HW86_9EURY|nr:LUD domain-containing protein [Natrarchaeobaculum aegyptiacum]ARS91490.1 lactate utilization protein C [Natrarchaeobaculum aegyptiacum]
MTTDTVGRFERALEDLQVSVAHVQATDATDAIESALEGPAVGVELPFEGVSLPDRVETAPTAGDLVDATTGVTPARFAIAEYGTVAIESAPEGDEPVALYPQRHVAVVAESDVVPDLGAGFDRLEAAFTAGDDSIVFATGRSSTADMGGLVEGVHGPGEVHVIVLEDR